MYLSNSLIFFHTDIDCIGTFSHEIFLIHFWNFIALFYFYIKKFNFFTKICLGSYMSRWPRGEVCSYQFSIFNVGGLVLYHFNVSLGAIFGAALLICLFVWYFRHSHGYKATVCVSNQDHATVTLKKICSDVCCPDSMEFNLFCPCSHMDILSFWMNTVSTFEIWLKIMVCII